MRVRYQKHRSPRSIIRAFAGGQVASIGGVDGSGRQVPDITGDEFECEIKRQGMWGFAETKASPPLIHFWTDGKRSPAELASFFGHELGHCTGKRARGFIDEEQRADSYGDVAREVLRLLSK